MRIIHIIQAKWDHVWDKKMSAVKVEQLQKIYVGKSRESVIRIYRSKVEKTLGVFGLVLCLLLILCVFGSSSEKKVDGQGRVRRQKPGGNVEEIELETQIAGLQKKVTVEVAPRKYTAEEVQAEFTRAKQYVLENYLGSNDSSDQITRDLQLELDLPESAVQLEWQMDSSQLIEDNGTIHWDQIETKTAVEITAVFRYEDEQETLPLQMTLYPPQYTEQEKLWKSWEKETDLLAEQTETGEYLQLPEKIRGKVVQYQETKPEMWKYLLAAAGMGILLLPLLIESRLRQEIAGRDREMLMDYPEVVEQYILLIGAGMTIKGAWTKIASDYLSMRQKGQQGYRFVYEEMLVTMRELESGMSELRAYELFGKRIGILSYMKFSTLLMQNLRKGSDDLLRILEYEAVDAFRQRKEQAKTLGEEAGTKLLMPMMLMLLVVLMMIIYAAFRSM